MRLVQADREGSSFSGCQRRQTHKPYHLSLSFENTINSVHHNAPTEKLIPWHQCSKHVITYRSQVHKFTTQACPQLLLELPGNSPGYLCFGNVWRSCWVTPYVSWDLDFSMIVSAQRIWLQLLKPHAAKISVCITELSHNIEGWMVRVQWVRVGGKQGAWYCKEENLRFLLNAQSQKCFTSQLTSAKSKYKNRIQYIQQKLFFVCEKVINDNNKFHNIPPGQYIAFFALLNHMMISWKKEPKELAITADVMCVCKELHFVLAQK